MYDKRYLYTVVRRNFANGSALSVQVESDREITHASIRSAVLVAFGNLASTTHVSISSDDAWDGTSYVVYSGGRVRRLKPDW